MEAVVALLEVVVLTYWKMYFAKKIKECGCNSVVTLNVRASIRIKTAALDRMAALA
ncbi:MAG: hypothetical protein ACTS73_01910 [Arsenophonus sp. NEOnobi-MAG3]